MRDILLYSNTAMNVKTVTFLLRIAIQISIVLETLDLVLDVMKIRQILTVCILIEYWIKDIFVFYLSSRSFKMKTKKFRVELKGFCSRHSLAFNDPLILHSSMLNFISVVQNGTKIQKLFETFQTILEQLIMCEFSLG